MTWCEWKVSLLCVCQEENPIYLTNSYFPIPFWIFSTAIFLLLLLFKGSRKPKKAKRCGAYKLSQKVLSQTPSSFHAWKFPVTQHYKLNQLQDLTFVARFILFTEETSINSKTPLSNQFAVVLPLWSFPFECLLHIRWELRKLNCSFIVVNPR